ncbi:MAG: hypothetical protein ACXWYJ_10470 [Actinomycetota bacterium]
MRYLAVMLVSLGVGAVVYLISMRTGEDEVLALGFEPDLSSPDEPAVATVEGPPPGYTYLQVAVTKGPSIHERLQGFIGSLALVAVATIAVAGALYTVGWVISRLISSFLGDDGGGEPFPSP